MKILQLGNVPDYLESFRNVQKVCMICRCLYNGCLSLFFSFEAIFSSSLYTERGQVIILGEICCCVPDSAAVTRGKIKYNGLY